MTKSKKRRENKENAAKERLYEMIATKVDALAIAAEEMEDQAVEGLKREVLLAVRSIAGLSGYQPEGAHPYAGHLVYYNGQKRWVRELVAFPEKPHHYDLRYHHTASDYHASGPVQYGGRCVFIDRIGPEGTWNWLTGYGPGGES